MFILLKQFLINRLSNFSTPLIKNFLYFSQIKFLLEINFNQKILKSILKLIRLMRVKY